MSAIAVEYGWPDFRPVTRTLATVDPTVLGKYVGSYLFQPGDQPAGSSRGRPRGVHGGKRPVDDAADRAAEVSSVSRSRPRVSF